MARMNKLLPRKKDTVNAPSEPGEVPSILALAVPRHDVSTSGRQDCVDTLLAVSKRQVPFKKNASGFLNLIRCLSPRIAPCLICYCKLMQPGSTGIPTFSAVGTGYGNRAKTKTVRP